ncbi:hypothetical protein [Tenacibaculum agarivorans]|uniref:hypothetical protein n=1 Tax=Tenacibaculum agarivorans TaxID=1908389 RepID=UPI000ADFEBF1|nr:hypothetical protein [Tenacibaculum agarivorans]
MDFIKLCILICVGLIFLLIKIIGGSNGDDHDHFQDDFHHFDSNDDSFNHDFSDSFDDD